MLKWVIPFTLTYMVRMLSDMEGVLVWAYEMLQEIQGTIIVSVERSTYFRKNPYSIVITGIPLIWINKVF